MLTAWPGYKHGPRLTSWSRYVTVVARCLIARPSRQPMSMAAPASPIAADVQCAESGKPSNDSRRLMNRLDEIRAKREDGWHAGLTWDDTDYLLERIEALEKVARAARSIVRTQCA